MKRNIDFSVDEFYHLYNRGTDKRAIFLDEKDYNRFMTLLFTANSSNAIHLSNYDWKDFKSLFQLKRKETLVDIGSYCLMPNHFHLLVHEKVENGITNFTQKLLTAYSMYFNKKYSRTGSLFEGRFKARHADDDQYLKYLFSYIHLNPIKLIDSQWKENGISSRERAEKYLTQYPYSSYKDYMGDDRVEKSILMKDSFPEYFKSAADFHLIMKEFLNFSDDR